MSKRTLLLEDCHEFIPRRDATGNIVAITESVGGRSLTRYPGRLSVIGEVNGNKRRYPEETWKANLAEGSTLQTLISKNAAFGLLEHPADGQINLLSPISHLVTKVVQEGKEIHGEITVLNTPEGKKLQALIEAGYNPTVSSRGFGTLVLREDGVEDVMPDFVCEGWDVVIRPSFGCAVLDTKPQPTQEGQKPAAAAAAPTPVASPAPKTITESQIQPPAKTIMKKSITESLAPIQALNPAALLVNSPKQFSESLQHLEGLHQEVANWAAEDPKRSYEATRLHESIRETEAKFHAAQQAPILENQKLKGNQAKLTAVLKTVTESAVSARKLVKESHAAIGRQKKVTETIAKRGAGWKTRAEKLEQKLQEAEEKLAKLNKNYQLACESLDLLGAKYNTDLTAVGKRVIELEFPQQVTESKHAEALKTATHPKQILAVRESITGKKEGTTIQEEKKDGDAAAAAAATKIQEDEKKAAADKAAKDEAARLALESQSVTVLRPTRGAPGSVSESINTVKNMRVPVAG